MKLFLTSSIGGINHDEEAWSPCELDSSNDFLGKLKSCWPKDAKGLMICSDPDSSEISDFFAGLQEKAFELSGLQLSRYDVCDSRNESRLADIISDYNVIVLAGGHVPTQNRFFKKIGLRELIRNFDGIVIGISAGTMNCAEVVYAQPELEGEAVDPVYQRYLDGLGLTNISVLPHFQEIKELTLDGLRILEDITYPDSRVRPIYALVDGSYILVENGTSTLYGEAYLIKDGVMTRICETGESIAL